MGLVAGYRALPLPKGGGNQPSCSPLCSIPLRSDLLKPQVLQDLNTCSMKERQTASGIHTRRIFLLCILLWPIHLDHTIERQEARDPLIRSTLDEILPVRQLTV